MAAELAIIAKLQDEASSGIRALRGEVEGLEPSAGIAAKGFATLQTVGAAALAALAAAAVAVGGAIASSISVAADFESQIAILSTAAGDAGTSLDTLRGAAMAVGADVSLVGVSASGAADAMTILYKAGLSTGEIFGDLNGYLSGNVELSGALRAAIDGAAASELDMAQAAELAATTLATFGGSMTTAEERAQFVNVALNNFVQTADASVASVADLAAAMTTIGPTAAQFGFSLQDTNTALAILSTRGIAGSEAGTALKSMFVNLMRPTEDVKGALNELGVSLYNADGTMRSMPSIIGDLSQALYGMNEVTSIVGGRTAEQNHQLDLAKKSYDQATDAIYKHNAGLKVLTDSNLQKYVDQQAAANAEIQRLSAVTGTASTAISQLTEEQRNQYITTLAGSYGMKAMAVLLMEGTAGWEAMEKAISEAATIQEVAAARTQTFSGAMEALQGVIETIQIGIGSAFLPVLTALAKALAQLASDNMQEIVQVFEAAGNALATFFDAIMSGTPPIQAFADSVAGLAEALGMPAEQVERLRERLAGLLTAVSNVIGPIVQAITSFVSWKDVLALLAIAIASVVIPAVIGFVQAVAPIVLIVAGLVAAVAALRNAWESDFLGIRSAVEGLVETFGRFVEAIRVLTDENARVQAMADVLAALPGPLQALALGVSTFLNALRDGEGLVAAFQAGLETLKQAIFTWAGAEDWSGVGQAILDKIASAFTNLGDRAATTAAGILNWISTAVNSIDWVAVGTAIVNGIAAAIAAVVGLLVTAGTAIAGFITGFFTNESLATAGTNIVAAIGNAISGAAAGIATGLDSIRQAIFDWAGADSWLEVGQTIIGKIADAFLNLGDKVAEVQAGIFNWIADAINGIDWHTVGESIINGIVAAITAVVGLLVTAGTAIVNYFIGFFTNDEIGPAGANIITALGNAISEFASGISDGLASVRDAIFEWAGVEDWSGVAEKIAEMIGEKLGEMGEAVSAQLSEWQTAIFDWADAEDWSGVAEHIAEMIGEKLGEARDAITGQLSEWQTAIFDWAGVEDWQGVAEKIAEGVGEKLGGAASAVVAQLTEWESAIFDWADGADWGDVAETVAEKVGEWLGDVSDRVTAKLSNWITAITDWVNKQDWKQIGYDMMDKIITAFTEWKERIAGKFNSWVTDVKTETEGYAWWEIGLFILSKIAEGAIGLVTDWVQAVGAWVTNIGQAIAQHLGNLMQLGRDIVGGIAAGIGAAGGLVDGAMQRLAQDTQTSAEHYYQTQSPSRLTMPIGYDVGSGVAVGITQSIGTVVAAIRNLAQATELEGVKAFGEAMKAIAAGVAAALSAILDIGSFQGAGDGFGAAMQALVDMMAAMVAAVAAANTYTTEVLENLGTFVEAAEAINDLLLQTADVVDYIGRWRAPDIAAANGSIEMLVGFLAQMVQGIVGLNLEAMLILGALGDFLDSAAELPGLFMGVADIVSYLAAWQAPGIEPVIANVQLLSALLGVLVTAVAEANTMGLGMLDILSAFIETATGIVGLIAPLADAMFDIANFPPGAEFSIMQRNIETMAGYLAQIVTAVAGANTMGLLSLEQLSVFVGVAGDIVALINPMAEAMFGIANFPQGADVQVMARNIETMAGYLHDLVAAIAESNTWGQLTLELLDQFVQVAGDIAELITPLAEAIWNIANFRSPDLFAFVGGIATLAGHLSTIVAWFYSGLNLSQAALEALGQYVEVMSSIAEGMTSFIDAIAAIAAFEPPDLFTFIGNVATLAGHLATMVAWFYSGLNLGQAALEALGQYIEVMSSIAEGMVSFIDAIAAIVGFQPPDLFVFVGNMATLAGHLATMVVWFYNGLNLSMAALEALGQYVEVIGDMVDLIADAIEALGLIAAYSGNTAALGPAIAAFAADLMLLVQTLATAFASASAAALVAILAAGEFADAVGDILGVVEDGVEALVALATYVPAANLGPMAQQFAVDLATVITTVVAALQQAGILASTAIVAAGELADGLGDVLGMVEDGVGALVELANYIPTAGLGALAQQFATDLAVVITAVVNALVAAQLLASEAVVKAGELADGLADILGVVADGVEAITALAAYIPAAGIGEKAQQFAVDLAAVVLAIVNGLVQAGLLANQAVAAAADLAGRLGDLLGVVAQGIEAIKAIAEYQGVAELSAKVQKFTSDLIAVAIILSSQLATAAQVIGIGTIDAARAFAAAVTALVGEVQAAVTGLGQLGGLAMPNIQPILTYIVASAQQIQTAFSAAGDIGAAVAYAAAFRANLQQLVTEIQAAVAALNQIAGTGTTGSIGAALAAIAASLQNTAGQFTGAGQVLANALITALAGGIGAGQGQVQGAAVYMLEATRAAGENVGRNFDSVGHAIIDAIASAVLGGQGQVIAAVTQVVNAAIAAGVAAARAAASVGQQLVQAAVNEVNNGRGQLDTAGSAAGNALIDGMARAITAGRSRVVSAIISTVTAAINAAKAALGIASPSKVAIDLLSNFMNTAASTVEGLRGRLADAMATAVSGAAAAAATGMSRVQLVPQPVTMARPALGDSLAERVAAAAVGRGGASGAAVGAGGTTQVVFYGNVVLPNVTDSRSFLEELDALRGAA